MDRRTLFIGLLTACFFFLLSGCVNNTDGPAPEKITAKEVLDKSFKASGDASSYSYKMTMRASMPGGVPGGASMDVMSLSGSVDKANKRMRLATVMNPLQASQNSETYIIGNTYYAKTPSGEWMKQETANADLWQKESVQDMQANLMNSSRVSFLPEENLDGVDCYVLNITPEKEKLPELLGKSSNLDDDTLGNIGSASIKEWVDKDSFLMKKVLFSTDMENSGNVIRMETEITFSDYGNVRAIELPAEARNAKAMETQSAKKPSEEDLRKLEEDAGA